MRGSTIVRRSGSSRITPGSEAHPAGVTTRGLEPGETHPAAFARPGLAGVPVVQRPRQIGQARRVGLFQVVGPPRRHPTLGPVPRHAQRPQIPSHRPMGRIGPPRIKIGFHLRQPQLNALRRAPKCERIKRPRSGSVGHSTSNFAPNTITDDRDAQLRGDIVPTETRREGGAQYCPIDLPTAR